MAEVRGVGVLAWALLLGGLGFAAPGPSAPPSSPLPASDSAAIPSDSLVSRPSLGTAPVLVPADSAVPVDSVAAAPAAAAAPQAPARPTAHSGDSRGSRGFPGAPLLLQIPVMDWPHNFVGTNSDVGLESPSMRQALLWNVAASQLGVQAIAWAWEGRSRPTALREVGLWFSLGAFSFLFTYLPPGEGWLHEEWHRAVLARRGAESHDGIYHYDIGASLIYVDGVQDADLEDLKRDHPADFIRLMSAGIESQVEAQRLMRRNNFFLGRSSRHDRFLWWVSGVNVSYYLAACANGWIDEDLAKGEAKEIHMRDRDFTGPDFTAWVHDLRRPREHYAAGPRGRVHPSGGPGYRRYLATSDLTGDERDYLNLQAALSLLNLATPQMWGPDWMPGALPWSGQRVLWNAGGAHHLTPFGYSLAADLLLRHGKYSWTWTVQGFVNSGLVLPGLSAQLWRYPVQLGRKMLFLTGGASLWLQPDGLLFGSDVIRPGAAALGGVSVPFVGGIEAWAEADAKTEGWVPGNVRLDDAVQARGGLAWRL